MPANHTAERFLHLAAIIDSSPDAIVSQDQDGIVKTWNRAAEKLFGYRASYAISRPLATLVNFGSDRESVSSYETTWKHQDGRELTVSITASRLFDEAGHVVGSSKIFRQITDRQPGDTEQQSKSELEAEIAERKRAEDRFRLVVEAAPNAMIMVGTDGRIALVNSQTEKLFGYDRGELLGQPVEMLVPERFRGGHVGHRAGFFNAPTARAMGSGRDLFGVRKDGGEVPIEIGLNPISSAEGHFVLASIIDITERKRAEERFRLVVEAAPNAMIMVGTDGRIALVNSQTEKLFGYDRGELLGQPVEMLVPERFRGGHVSHRAGFFSAPTARAMGSGRDLFGVRKNGSEVPIEIGLNPISSAEGHFVLASIIDITERKRAEERFRLVVEAAPNAMIMVGTDGRIALVNSQTEKLFGYDRGELLGQPVEMLVPERFRGGHVSHRAGFFSAPTARAMGSGRDLFGIRKDGEEVPIEIGLNPISSAEGHFVLASIIDITERKRAEERFRLVVEAAPNAMIMVGTGGRIALVNSQTERLFGYNRQDLLGQPVEMLVPARFRSAHGGLRTGFFSAPTARAMGSGRDLFGIRKDGGEVPIEIGLNPISSAEGNFVLASIIDITERKRSEDEIAAAKLEVESRNKDLETMLHVTSHDLREPLRAIQNFAGLLSERYASQIDDKGKDLLNRVRRAAERLDRLVQDILNVARAGRISPPEDAVSGRLIVADALRVLGSRITETRAHVQVAENLPSVRVSLVWGSVAIQNLVANALKFARENSVPEIEICGYESDQGQEVGIMVRDRGVGVSERHAERIFELFQRAVGREVEGTGAGLAIVRQIAERHGGRAWVQSRDGGGSDFIITFGRVARREARTAKAH